MDPKVKKLWLKALKSGKYKRATGVLKTPRGHCCLGVLCEVALQQKVIDQYNTQEQYLSRRVAEWANLSEGKQKLLARINDYSHTRGFVKQIEEIEKNL